MIGVTSDNGLGLTKNRLSLFSNETCNLSNGFTDNVVYGEKQFLNDVQNFVSVNYPNRNFTDFVRDSIRFVYTDWNNKLLVDFLFYFEFYFLSIFNYFEVYALNF